MNSKKIHFSNFFSLKCPYCGTESLKKKGALISFKESCSQCRFQIEREAGYFTGAMWMIHYTAMAVICALVGILFFFYSPKSDPMIIVSTMVSMIVLSIFFYPYSKGLWLYLDHYFHPIDENDLALYKKNNPEEKQS